MAAAVTLDRPKSGTTAGIEPSNAIALYRGPGAGAQDAGMNALATGDTRATTVTQLVLRQTAELARAGTEPGNALALTGGRQLAVVATSELARAGGESALARPTSSAATTSLSAAVVTAHSQTTGTYTSPSASSTSTSTHTAAGSSFFHRALGVVADAVGYRDLSKSDGIIAAWRAGDMEQVGKRAAFWAATVGFGVAAVATGGVAGVAFGVAILGGFIGRAEYEKGCRTERAEAFTTLKGQMGFVTQNLGSLVDPATLQLVKDQAVANVEGAIGPLTRAMRGGTISSVDQLNAAGKRICETASAKILSGAIVSGAVAQSTTSLADQILRGDANKMAELLAGPQAKNAEVVAKMQQALLWAKHQVATDPVASADFHRTLNAGVVAAVQREVVTQARGVIDINAKDIAKAAGMNSGSVAKHLKDGMSIV